MKFVPLFILTFLSFNIFAASVTITKEQIIGEWVSHYGFGNKKPANATSNFLKITSDFNITLIRPLSSGGTQTFHASQNSIEINSDIYIFSFPAKSPISYKLVLSGWVNGNSKLLFGMLYLYNNGELYNGIPVSFKPKGS